MRFYERLIWLIDILYGMSGSDRIKDILARLKDNVSELKKEHDSRAW